MRSGGKIFCTVDGHVDLLPDERLFQGGAELTCLGGDFVAKLGANVPRGLDGKDLHSDART